MMAIRDLVECARNELSSLTGLTPSTALGASRDERGWRITVELVEKHSIPDGMDILGTYDALYNEEGDLLEFNRKRLRKRIDTGDMES